MNQNNEKLAWYNNEKIFVPIMLAVVGISALIIFLASQFK